MSHIRIDEYCNVQIFREEPNPKIVVSTNKKWVSDVSFFINGHEYSGSTESYHGNF